MVEVLVIDDDETTLALMRAVLQDEGIDVLTTADGPQGISIYKQKHPSLVVLDLALPSMSGLEVLRKIRALDEAAKVLIVTGHGTEEAGAVAFGYGVAGFIPKPLDVTSFLTKIRSILNL